RASAKVPYLRAITGVHVGVRPAASGPAAHQEAWAASGSVRILEGSPELKPHVEETDVRVARRVDPARAHVDPERPLRAVPPPVEEGSDDAAEATPEEETGVGG
ncbi:MAG TPA: hypothetical protein VGS21_09795, partial [Acidimicrobiales bacterium]|nr:hypothetical protein [Acidimicrobiales bacterium]